jgi:hypothetical protein
MNSAAILVEENKKLCTENQCRKQKQQYRRWYIAQGGVLQAQQGQFLLQGEGNSQIRGIDNEVTIARRRALPTCSNCGIQGHRINQCPNT